MTEPDSLSRALIRIVWLARGAVPGPTTEDTET